MQDNQSEMQGVDTEFDLRPDPRVLPMLGEINLEQWRCLSELIDNSIDGFLHERRQANKIDEPQVFVDLPNADVEDSILKIRDNGPGMAPDILQRAVSAGWSGNNPIDNLGLFGMGFNIATARLGSVTEVWTTRQGDHEWHGLVIDFEKLRQQKHFKTPHIRRPKSDINQHGTEVTLKRLKPQQRTWLARSANHTLLRKRLSEIYSAMLRENGAPLSFKLSVNNRRVLPRNHCVWGEDRFVGIPNLGDVPAIIPINFNLSDRNYCTNCMNWLAADSGANHVCLVCNSQDTIINRSRKVWGWIGLQRYLDKTDFGFDLIRNGRKIELYCKDLFIWRDDQGEDPEYPIDDQRGRGRFVGEIHIDHCRVNYTKDRFDRTDPAWEEMITLIRGEGPLRPQKAKDLGILTNESPLFRLFSAYRRTSPQAKVAGAWKRILVVNDNQRASEMANNFHEGHPDYLDDGKWWELIEEADRELLHGQMGGRSRSSEDSTKEDNSSGIVDDILAPANDLTSTNKEKPDEIPKEKTKYSRQPMPSLDRKYLHSSSGHAWNVKAFAVDPRDHDLGGNIPWRLMMADTATRTYHFLVSTNHSAFRSMTLTPRDALLMELAWLTADYLRDTPTPPLLSEIVSEFRQTYGKDEVLDARQIQPDAAEVLGVIVNAFLKNVPETDRATLFDNLSVDERNAIMRRLAHRKIQPSQVLANGSFLEYAPLEFVAKFVDQYPEYCFDGAIWDEPYQSSDFGNPDITNDFQAKVRERYCSLINDVCWLASQEASTLNEAPREELIRAIMSLRLIRPDAESY